MSRAALDAPRLPASDPRTNVHPHASGAEDRNHSRLRALLRRPLVACTLLLVAYGALSMANDPRGTLLGDSGGKIATVRSMDEHGRLDPNVGYWAAEGDPRGELHALRFTTRVGDKWLQATTLPMLYASYPLYEVGGSRALLTFPLIGGVLCALAARALARRWGSGDGWPAFWAVGLLTPVSLYAVSFWEHTLGLAASLWGIVVLLDVVDRRAGWRGALVGGALFAMAAVMRTEALVYFAVTAIIVCVALRVSERSWRGTVTTAGAIALGFVGVVLLNVALEVATVGSSVRMGRTAGAASTAGSTVLDRVAQGVITTTGLNGYPGSVDWLIGALIVALLGFAVSALTREHGPRLLAVAALVWVGVLYVARFSGPSAYVPGVLVASPLAAVGAIVGWRERRLTIPILVALVPIPLVWATQFTDTMRPQWGGRYTLASGAMLAVMALVVLAPWRRALVVTLVVAAVVTGYGIAFLGERSRAIAHGMQAIVARHDGAVISLEAHLLREGGAFYSPSRHWLTAVDDLELRRAVGLVHDAGDHEFALLVPDWMHAPRSIQGYERMATQRVQVRPHQALSVVTYRNPDAVER